MAQQQKKKTDDNKTTQLTTDMGQRASTMVSDVADDDETVFMVPSYINLSVDQMNVMLNAGQQPGVPFRLAAGGAERPQGVRKKVWFAENRVAIQKSTIKLVESDDDEGCYALEFLYDASVPAVVKVLVGARDVVGAVKGAVTLADTVVSYGPYVLREGRNRAWSSVRDGDGAAVQWQQLLRHRAVHHAQQATVGGGADGLVATSQPERVYDVVVVLAPADALATCPLLAAPSPTAAVASAAMHRGTAPGDDGKPPARLHSASSPGNKNLRKVSPTGSRAPSLAGKGLGATLGLGLGLARGGGEEKDGDGDRARQAAVSVLCEVTYCLAGPAAALAVDAATLQALARDADRLRGPLSSAAGSSARGGAADVLSAREVSLAPTATPINPFGAAIAVRCASQRVQLASGGVYAIQVHLSPTGAILHHTTLHRTALHCTAPHRIASHRIASYHTAPQSSTIVHNTHPCVTSHITPRASAPHIASDAPEIGHIRDGPQPHGRGFRVCG